MDTLPDKGNAQIAKLLYQVADLLQAQHANEHRTNAWRKAAAVVERFSRPLEDIYAADGFDGLDQLPQVGQTIGRAIEFYLKAGFIPILSRLRGELRPSAVFETVPDIGTEMAKRIHQHLHIESLHELHQCALDGRLEKVPGMGPKRLRAVRECLAGRFRLRQTEGETQKHVNMPSAQDLLALDDEYRQLVESGSLPLTSPRRLNPTGKAWLPIWHTQVDGRNYTVMYSNSARAHALGKTKDWVIIILDDTDQHGQWTVITSTFGRTAGLRIVRGLDDAIHYNGFRPDTTKHVSQDGGDPPTDKLASIDTQN